MIGVYTQIIGRAIFFCVFFRRGVYTCVPGKRAAGQRQVIVVMQEAAVDEIDRHLAAMGFSDRASFIRQAIAEKLELSGYGVPKEMLVAPSRAGKGGRPKKKKGDELPSPSLKAARAADTEGAYVIVRRGRKKKNEHDPNTPAG